MKKRGKLPEEAAVKIIEGRGDKKSSSPGKFGEVVPADRKGRKGGFSFGGGAGMLAGRGGVNIKEVLNGGEKKKKKEKTIF